VITVWCANTNGHAPQSEVDTLRRQVDRHLKEWHIFKCMTESDLPGWWCKTQLFGSDKPYARNLWLDLDVTITGALDPLVVPLNGSQLRIAKNWAQSGHGGCQSSVMYWEGDSARVISDTFDQADAHWPPRTDKHWNNGQVQWGDQEWITCLRDMNHLQVEYFYPAHVQSYKYHCRAGLPEDCRVAVFHGKPKPSEVADGWVMKCRS